MNARQRKKAVTKYLAERPLTPRERALIDRLIRGIVVRIADALVRAFEALTESARRTAGSMAAFGEAVRQAKAEADPALWAKAEGSE
jgi:Ser/Thr protein kinase RdoA (MazF antagonist)